MELADSTDFESSRFRTTGRGGGLQRDFGWYCVTGGRRDRTTGAGPSRRTATDTDSGRSGLMELQLTDIVKEFGSYEAPEDRVVAVDTVNLHVNEGELVTLLGPSGCGKTTLLRMISGFEDPTRGDIFFGTTRVNNVAPNKRNSTLVFQSYAIFPHLDVFENIAFGLRLKHLAEREIQERMARVLDLVGLSGLERRPPSQLSGGQQQRVALARAIIMEPQLLLFDEPLSNLFYRESQLPSGTHHRHRHRSHSGPGIHAADPAGHVLHWNRAANYDPPGSDSACGSG